MTFFFSGWDDDIRETAQDLQKSAIGSPSCLQRFLTGSMSARRKAILSPTCSGCFVPDTLNV